MAPYTCRKGIELKVNGVTYPNNSIIELSASQSYCTPLACTSDLHTQPANTGAWYYPNGTEIPTEEAGHSFYVSRNNEGALFLHRRNNAEHPTGHYCCSLSTIGTKQTMCAEIGSKQLT